MFQKFKSLNLNEKIIIIILIVTYICISIKGLLNKSTLYDTVGNITSFLILFLWLFLYNNEKNIRTWFDNNKLRILLTIMVAILFLYFKSFLFISTAFTKKIVDLLQSFLIASFLNELSYKNLIDSNDAVMLIISFCGIPVFLKNDVHLVFAFFLTILSSYIIFGIMVKLFKKIKKEKELIVNIIGITISIASLIISIIIQ